MRLVNPGAGEITDRLSVLSLKILFGGAADKDCAHFKTERTTLLSQIRSRTLNGVWFECALELAAVNAAIWHGEDDLRTYRQTGPSADQTYKSNLEVVVSLAFRLQELNDQRAALRQKINELSGEALGEEKV